MTASLMFWFSEMTCVSHSASLPWFSSQMRPMGLLLTMSMSPSPSKSMGCMLLEPGWHHALQRSSDPTRARSMAAI